jgi:hypothetical protein
MGHGIHDLHNIKLLHFLITAVVAEIQAFSIPPDTLLAFMASQYGVTDRQDHAPQSSHHHSRTVDLCHDCSYRICYLQHVGWFHYGFICYESFRLSHLLSVCLIL